MNLILLAKIESNPVMYTRCQYRFKRCNDMFSTSNMCGKPVYDNFCYCRSCAKVRYYPNGAEEAYLKSKIQRYDDNHWRDPVTNFIFYKDKGLIYIVGVKTVDGIRDVTDNEIKLIEQKGWIYETFCVKGALDD